MLAQIILLISIVVARSSREVPLVRAGDAVSPQVDLMSVTFGCTYQS
jgi:hypothetical protein